MTNITDVLCINNVEPLVQLQFLFLVSFGSSTLETLQDLHFYRHLTRPLVHFKLAKTWKYIVIAVCMTAL